MATATDNQLLYITYFGRPADPSGLRFWNTAAQAGLPKKDIANAFAQSEEFVQDTVGLTTQQIINRYYRNLFGRDAEAAGLAYWTNEVNQGRISIQLVGLVIAESALSQPSSSADRVAVESKLQASGQWTTLVAADAQATLEFAGPLALTFGADFLQPVLTPSDIPSVLETEAQIALLPPVGTIGLLSSSAPSVTEGGTVVFTIETIPSLSGSLLSYTLSGIQAADLVGGSLTGSAVVNSQGIATVQVTLAIDALVEPAEVLTISVRNVVARPQGGDSVFVVDTTIPPAQAVLTEQTDVSGLNITAPPLAGSFVYFANEQTLGQNDQLVVGPGSTAQVTLNVGTQGNFNLRNFSTTGIQTLELRPSGEDFSNNGFVDLQAATGLQNINVNQSQLGVISFNDIQSIENFTTRITDSISDFAYNFDAGALLGVIDAVNIVVQETPIDATTGAAVGFDFTQGPVNTDAGIELINLISTGPVLNVVDQLSVGDDLETLLISGDASLDITTDLGLFPNGNRRINLIDAFALTEDLTLSYTSELGDVINDFLPDVVVLGAQGDNTLTFGTQSLFSPTDFSVETFDGDDFVITADGDDGIDVGEGDNRVIAGNGQNTVAAGSGDDVIITGAGADLITAGAGDNEVLSGAGNDTIVTLEGDDFINAGQGDDSVLAGDGDNTVFGDNFAPAGNDTIVTGSGDDFIVADAFVLGQVQGAGNDSVDSGAGDDTVYTGSGRNTVIAGSGDDLVVLGETAEGGPISRTPQFDNFANSVLLGEGDDIVRINTEALTIADLINGGEGFDIIELFNRPTELFNGGTLGASETLRVSRVEALDLRGIGGYDITLTDELVRTSDDLQPNGSRRFSVFTGGQEFPPFEDLAGNVRLDLSFLTPVDAQGNLLSIFYEGQNDTDFERVIIRDGLINDQLILEFGEAPLDADETFADVLQIVDSADVTLDDLVNVFDLEVIELASSVNGPQAFTFDFRNFSLNQFDDLVGDTNDILIIRATSLLAGAVSTLNIDLTGADGGISGRIRIEQSADLNVNVTSDPGFVVPITTALFYTPNADFLIGTGGNDTFTAFQLSDVQAADTADGLGGSDTLFFEFAVSNAGASLATQLDFTDISDIETFRFSPAAVNQPVRFSFIGLGFAAGLESIRTAGGSDFLTNIERSLFINADEGNNTVSMALGAAGTIVTGSGNDSIQGSAFGGNDSILSGAGNDTVNGSAGADFIDAGDGNDSVLGGTGNDTILSASGDNIIDAGTGDDSVVTGAGDDSILGGTGSDTINAGDGTNTVLAGTGADLVVSGTGNDSISTAAALEIENDTVASGAGLDTILVGLGDDSVAAGADDDLIVLAPAFGTASGGILHTNTAGGFTPGDRINGGLGTDTLVFGLDLVAASTTTVTGVQVQNVEVLNVATGAANQTLVLDTSLLPTGGRLSVNLDGDFINDGANFTLNATSFVQGQAVDVFTSGLDTSSIYLLGAGDDTFTNFSGDDSDNVTVVGNGGSDTISLDDFANQVVRYVTGNDGGTGGTGTGGDFITGYSAPQDSIQITGGLLTDVGGVLNPNVTNAQLTLGGLGDFVGIFQGLASGRNVLSLTGPARSLLDTQLFDAQAIANNINGIGVVGNGLNIGDAIIGIPFTSVTNVTNQALIVQQGQTETALYLYTESSFNFEVAQAYTVEASELRQLGVFDNALFTGTELTI